MSTLLEQAIIDVKELKESAKKAAEKEILEQKKDEIKKSIDKFLFEQEDEELGNEIDLLDSELESTPELDPISAEIPLAATDGENMCACPDEDEEIEIDFAQLAQHINEPEDLNSGPELGSEDDELSGLEDVLGGLSEDQHNDFINTILESIEAKDLEDVHQDEKPDKQYEDVKEILDKLEDEDVELPDNFMESSEDDEKGKKPNVKVDVQVPVSSKPSAPTESEKKYLEDLALAKDKHDSEVKELKKQLKEIKELFNKEKDKIAKLKLTVNEWKELTIRSSNKLKEIYTKNSILHYQNEILKMNSLNERQKEKIVESLSKVESVEQAKLVFESYMYEPPKVSTIGNKEGKTLTETINRTKNTLILKGNAGDEIDKNNSSYVKRMQELAGIK